MVQRKCKSNTIKLAWIAEVQPLFKIFNGCRDFFQHATRPNFRANESRAKLV